MKRVRMRFTSFVRVVTSTSLAPPPPPGFGPTCIKLWGYHLCRPCRDPSEEEQVRGVAPSRFFDVTAPCRLKSLTADSALFGHGVFEP